jgi:hypothetical protein
MISGIEYWGDRVMGRHEDTEMRDWGDREMG